MFNYQQYMKYFTILFCLLFIGCSTPKEKENWETYYELSGFTQTPDYAETVAFCKRLAEYSEMVHYEVIGKSAAGYDIPMLIIDKKHQFNPETVRRRKKAVVMIQACIHAGEPDGKDAGFLLIRDLVIHNKYAELIDSTTIIFLPVLNPDGHLRFGENNRINQNGPEEMGWRTNSNNLNLNRDYLKAETPEIQAWLKVFNNWLPDFVIDCHVTDGADYQYQLTYGLETNGNMESNLTNWVTNTFEAKIVEQMNNNNMPIFPYVMFNEWHNPLSGLVTFVSPPSLSTGYVAQQNRAGLLIETHMLKDYKTRVNATFELLKLSLEIIDSERNNLIALNRNADDLAANETFRKTPFPINFKLNENDTAYTEFLGVRYSITNSELSNGAWFQYSDTAETFSLPIFKNNVPSVSVQLPEAYIIQQEWKSVIQLLSLHNIHFKVLEKDTNIVVNLYKLTNVTFSNTPYEGKMRAFFDAEEFTDTVFYKAGSVVVPMNQRTARVIAYLLEPQAAGSLAYWGYFNAIFEQKEYAETYVMENLAREMLRNDSLLAKEFEQKKLNDKEFANNSWEILNWFYHKSIYGDSYRNVYPIGRIMNNITFE